MTESEMSQPGPLNYSLGGQRLNVYIQCYLNKKPTLVLGVVVTVKQS